MRSVKSVTVTNQPKAASSVMGVMNIVYNSDNYYVVEYPVQHGYEVVDKQSSRGTYFQGDVADKFFAKTIAHFRAGRVDRFGLTAFREPHRAV